MAIEDSELADYYKLQYTATRLEDLPRKDTMQRLAEWLNIKYLDFNPQKSVKDMCKDAWNFQLKFTKC